MILGVGSGHLKPEFKTLGADFERRGPISDEYLRAIAAAWEADVAEFRGDTVAFHDVMAARVRAAMHNRRNVLRLGIAAAFMRAQRGAPPAPSPPRLRRGRLVADGP